MAGLLPPIKSASSCAVASEVVMPRPSCPVARKTVSSSAEGPINGSLSGVAERNPVHERSMESDGNDGQKLGGALQHTGHYLFIHFPSLDTVLARRTDQQLAVRLGCTLKATVSVVVT